MVALAVSQSLATLEWLGGHFSPATLFATSEPGVWYDPSDVANTNWLYNLLTFTEQFDNAIWTKTASSVTANSTVAPDGTTTADTIVALATLGQHRVDQVTTIAAGTYTFSCYVKTAGYDYAWLRIGLTPSVVVSLVDGSLYNLTDGTATATNVGNGWWRIALSGSCLANSTCRINISSDNSGSTFTGNGTSGIFVWGAQLELGSTATTYQPITTVNAGTIARFPLATLYQDSAGTTPVTAPNQPVGLMLDKSQGLVLGPELVTNGDFSSGTTGWTYPGGTGGGGGITVSNGRLRLTVATPLASIDDRMVYTQLSGLTVGRSYAFSGFMIALTGTVDVRLTVTAVAIDAEGNGILGTTASQSGETITSIFTATATTMYVHGYARGTVVAGSQVAFDNISVKLLPGNHATQSTSGSRPTYGIVPATGRRNLLTYSEQFDNAVWSKDAVGISANSTTAPNGTLTADTCTPNTATSAHLLFQTTTVSGSNVQSVYVKANGYTKVALREGQTGAYFASFDLSGSGSVLFTSSATATITAVGNGWFRIAVVGTLTGTTRLALYVLDPSYTTGSVTSSWTPNGTSGIFIWGAQLETGSTATAYQKVVTSFEVTEANVASLSYIFFDGIDDFMITPTITPGTDKVQVFAGVRKLSDAALGIVAELAVVSGASNPGSFFLAAPRTAATGDFAFNCGGSAFGTGAISANSFAAPTTRVMTGIGDISGDVVTLRIDGAQVATSASDQGTGNFGNYPLYIGRRGGTTLPFNGQMYGLITRFGANLNTSQLVSTEGWMNTKTRPL